MRRWILRLLLIAVLPWQGMAWAAGTVPHEDAAWHAVAHWSGEAHHHHAVDHSHDPMHPDDSIESLLHVVHANAHCHAPAVLPAAPNCPTPGRDVIAPDAPLVAEHPHPFIEGPRRPPRSPR